MLPLRSSTPAVVIKVVPIGITFSTHPGTIQQERSADSINTSQIQVKFNSFRIDKQIIAWCIVLGQYRMATCQHQLIIFIAAILVIHKRLEGIEPRIQRIPILQALRKSSHRQIYFSRMHVKPKFRLIVSGNLQVLVFRIIHFCSSNEHAFVFSYSLIGKFVDVDVFKIGLFRVQIKQSRHLRRNAISPADSEQIRHQVERCIYTR